MNWKKLFTPTGILTVTEAREFMEQRAATDFQLLDVRQPKEYEESHLPGARLIPLKELPDRLGELNREQPVIAYCAVGGRSKAAVRLLSGQGFGEVYNLSGGIKAWSGAKATGPPAAGLELLPAGADYGSAVALALAMEAGLQHFYLQLAEAAAEYGLRPLYRRLAAFEERHQERLLAEDRRQGGTAAPDLSPTAPSLLEGGRHPDDAALAALVQALTPTELLAEAMGLETQALDLYLRLARHSENPTSRRLFQALAAEEKEHLALLATELERQ